MRYHGPRFVAIDLFAGAGGLTQGLKQAGFEVLGAIEINDLAVETYKVNHPRVKVWHRDISRIQGADILRALGLKKGELDLLAGCPPCQGFSAMRTLNGSRKIIDIRNDLVFEFLRLVKELEPKAVMMENVPALTTDIRMNMIRRALRKLGYKCECRVLDAADYGVPQRRRRMILLAARQMVVKPAGRVTERTTVRTAISRFATTAGTSGDALHDFPEKRSDDVLQRIRDIPENGGSRTDLGPDRQLNCHKDFNGFKDVYGRMRWDTVAPTITTGCFNPSKGRFLHPTEHRNITLREAALLQSFPYHYYFSLRSGKTNAAIMIGNALPPLFIQCHAVKINRFLTRKVR